MARLTKEQTKDAGLALLLLTFIYLFFIEGITLVAYPSILLLIIMIVPGMLKPFAIVWYGFAELLARMMSVLLLGLAFYMIVTPIGLFRRALGSDPFQLKEWKRSNESVFVTRELQVEPTDLQDPY